MTIRIKVFEEEDRLTTALKIAAAAAMTAAGVTVAGILLARDQMKRHRRELFSPHPVRRLAALGYMRAHPHVDNVMLLRDFLAWEERPLLQKRAAAVLESLEEALATGESEAS